MLFSPSDFEDDTILCDKINKVLSIMDNHNYDQRISELN